MNNAKPLSAPPGVRIDLRVLIAIALPFILLPLCWGVFHFVIAHAHYAFGAIPALFVLGAIGSGFAVLLQGFMSDRRGKLPVLARTVVTILVSLTSLFMLATVCAWISYVLWKTNLAQLATADEPTYSDLVKVYFWHLIDVIPFTNVEGTLDMKLPEIRFHGGIGGAPILFFRFAVVFFVLETLRRSWHEVTSAGKATTASAK